VGPHAIQKGEPFAANPFVHVELHTNDPAKARAFYSQLFSWKLEDMEMGPGMTYTMVQPGEGTGGGMMKQMMPGAPSAWLAYVIVDDVKAATAKAKALGAQVLKDVDEVPGMGWFSVVADPTGAPLGPQAAKRHRRHGRKTREWQWTGQRPIATGSAILFPVLSISACEIGQAPNVTLDQRFSGEHHNQDRDQRCDLAGARQPRPEGRRKASMAAARRARRADADERAKPVVAQR
jgi:predicted enzyme related to lactoylglutathione lyase